MAAMARFIPENALGNFEDGFCGYTPVHVEVALDTKENRGNLV